jgi:hypothetical protein
MAQGNGIGLGRSADDDDLPAPPDFGDQIEDPDVPGLSRSLTLERMLGGLMHFPGSKFTILPYKCLITKQ